MDIDNVIKLINSSTKAHYKEVVVDGKVVNSVTNYGAKKGERAKLARNGEYFGIAVEFLEDVKRLLTDKFMIRILHFVKKEDYITIMNMLDLVNVDQINYVIHRWCQNSVADYDNSLVSKKKFPELDWWIESDRATPLPGKIRVTDVGQNKNTGDSVVPLNWLGREFANGREMHEAMNKLDSRLGKPPVTYAIIYSMQKQVIETNVPASELVGLKNKLTLYVDLKNDKIMTTMSKGYKDGYTYVIYGSMFIGFVLEDLLEDKNDTCGGKNVSMLVSRLQKCIRRGRYARKILDETVDRINECSNYNLPEHGFLRVSASKQLVWRLFISILEDCRPYVAKDELSLLDLICLTLICNKCLEYKFTPALMKLIKLTAILAQFNDEPQDLFDWRKETEATSTVITKSNYHSAISIALGNMIMMKGDNMMLRKLYSAADKFLPFAIPTKVYHDQQVYDDVALSSIDHHCFPHIILYYQACKTISKTTKDISSYIWNVSSSYNVRNKKVLESDKTLKRIQQYIIDKPSNSFAFAEERKPVIEKNMPNERTKRTSFLILFGKKYKAASKEIILCGSLDNPANVKIESVWMTSNDPALINGFPVHTIRLNKIAPPFGYQWTKNAVTVKIKDGVPMIDDEKIPFFDGTSILKSNIPRVTKNIKKKTYQTIVDILAGSEIEFDTIIKFRNKQCKQIYNWLPSGSDLKKIDIDLVKASYMKIFNQMDNIIMVGPVDRLGKKMANSINYIMEGKIWAVFNVLSYLYPDTLKPNSNLNFVLNKSTASYAHMILSLEKICFTSEKSRKTKVLPTIVTPLWPHQMESVKQITDGFNKGFHGKGDASDVGSGKTLTSLSIATELIKNNDSIYSGILVMLPGPKLIDTWKGELDKHTKNFDIVYQKNNADIGPIKNNTIVISTMAKVRDHPISHHWLLVVIDECLTVQNNNALQTEEAWRQSLMSKHLLLMSATFFRTRFDKLYYMLKMLQTGLPEGREYLDCILVESIVSKVSVMKRKWSTNINYFELDAVSRKEYELINEKTMAVDAKYSKLDSYLTSTDRVNNILIGELKKLLTRMEKGGHRCLIYAKSKNEAVKWSEALGIELYPVKGKHTIVTLNDGTYGLNDLVIYDTIVMKIPAPDKLVQIKGRLDRPGQKAQDLHIEYFIFKDTVDEGLIIRMNMCSGFVKTHIMPLSKFYKVSTDFTKYVAK